MKVLPPGRIIGLLDVHEAAVVPQEKKPTLPKGEGRRCGGGEVKRI